MMRTEWQPCAQFATSWQDATVPENECSTYLRSVGFDPLPKQYDFITCPYDDVGFGGARGGSKSHAIIGDFMWHEHEYGENALGIVFRRERVQLMELIERARREFDRINASIESKTKWKWHAIDKQFESPTGARLRFSYLDKDADADGYMGHEYTRVYIEERGTFPREAVLNKLQATLRSGRGVPCQLKSTFNPGGVGHQHCKERYQLHDKIPNGYRLITTPEGLTRMFIPSKLRDNKYLGDDYIRQLRAACAGNEALLNAWLDGDWSLIEGAFFHDWRGAHVIPGFEIPKHWTRFRSFHWGSAKPASVGWWAVATEPTNYIETDGLSGEQRPVVLPRGSLVRYREWYIQKSIGSNEGLKITAEAIAHGIKDREAGERMTFGVASPQIFASKGGPSIAERMASQNVFFMPGDDTHSAQLGNYASWDALRARLVGADGIPTIFCFNSCADSVRTIPALQHDRKNPEDIDDESEAAAAHEWRYAASSRAWINEAAKPHTPGGVGLYGDANGTIRSTLTISEMIAHKTRKRKAAEDD